MTTRRHLQRVRAVRVHLLALGLWIAAGAHAAGQTTGGSIIGQVVDESGSVLPGVTVTASSPALQVGSTTSVTDGNGEYRLVPLPVGTYTVSYELQGFQAVRREGIRLTVGFIARLDVALSVGGLEETITVSGAVPLVDVSSTAPATQFTQETLEVIPTSRNGLLGLMAQAPGVRGQSEAGGAISFQAPNVRVFGQVGESWNLLEGVMTTALQGTGGVGNYWDYSTIHEASVQTLGSDAEVPIRGVSINGIVKSGGNDFDGSVFVGYMNSNLQSNNIDDQLAAVGITRGAKILGRYDVSGDVGGRIISDRLWFYGSARKRKDEVEVLGAVKDDGSQASNVTGQEFLTGKLSFQLNAEHRFVGFWQRANRPSTTTTAFTDWDSRTNNPVLVKVWKGEWQTVPNKSVIASLQFGYWGYTDGPRISFSRDVSRMDTFTLRVSGAHLAEGETIDYHRWHPKGSLSWYKPDLLLGNHEFKAGFDFLPNFGHRGNVSRESANYRLLFRDGAPLQILAFNSPTAPEQHINYLGVFLQDTWTIRRRLTLNAGLRYNRDDAYVPAACRENADGPSAAVFPAACFERVQWKVVNTLSPRLRAAYDLTGTGTTVLKGGWGRYNRIRQVEPDIEGADPQQKQTATYRWRDLNGNRDYDLGEVNWDPNGPDFVSSAGGANRVPNPDEKTPQTDEFSASVEHQFFQTLAVRATGVYSKVTNVYRLANLRRPAELYSTPVTRSDPGPDGVASTGDDPGRTVTYYEYPASVSGRAFELFTVINDPAATQRYKSIELAVSRRMQNRWQMAASFSATRTDNPLVAAIGEFSLTNAGADANPNAEINSSNQTWDWLGRASGAYLLPADVTLSASFEHRSGLPQARTVQFTGGVLSSITLRVEPIGSIRLPAINTLDVRVEKGFDLPRGQRLQARVNVYNLMNVSTVTAQTVASGPNFLRPTAIVGPRIAEFSLTYRFR